MYIVKPIHDIEAFHDEFKACGAGNRYSREAFKALFEHLTLFAYQQDETYELDVIAECEEWREFNTVQDAIDAHPAYIKTLDDLKQYFVEVIELPSGGVLMTSL